MGRRKLADALSLAALPLGVVVWSSAMLGSHLSLGGLGLVGSLPPSWYAASALMVAGFIAAIHAHRHHVLLMSYAIVLLIVIVSTGALLERSPRFPYVFNSYHYGAEILRTSTIDFRQSYLSWPGWHAVTALAIGASSVAPSDLLTWIPLWLSVATLGALSALFRRYRMPRQQGWYAILIAVVAFLSPIYPVPGAAAMLIAICLVAIVTEEYTRRQASTGARVGIVLLLAALVITHLLTSLVGIAVVAGVSLIVILAWQRRPGPAAVNGMVLLLTYLLYVAVTITAAQMPGVIQGILSLDQLLASIFGTTAAGVGGGSAAHTRVVSVRIAYVVGLAGLGAIGGLIALVQRGRARRWLLPSTWIAASIGSFGLGNYGGEIIGRAANLAAPGSIALASWVSRLGAGRALLWAALFAAALGSPIMQFGNEIFDFVRPTELAVDAVLAERHPQTWSLVRPSRTWAGEYPSSGGAYVTVYGPLFDTTQSFFSKPQSPAMPYWSYNNGDIRIMVSAGRLP